GRMDAVFRTPDGRYDVVDWKTGHPPTGAAARAAAVQLATYRLAWADLSGTPLDRVGAAFHYVRVNQTVRPVDLLDASGLRARARSLPPAPCLLAWPALSGPPLARVGAASHHVRGNQTVRTVDLLDASGLAALIESIPTA